jgi:lipopolysaccharide transport system permease protein
MKTIVDAEHLGIGLKLGELVAYRDLLFTLAYRDIRIRYAQTYFGMLWALIQPLALLFIYTLIFHRVADVDTGGAPYVLFAMVGMAPWAYFSFVATQAGYALVVNRDMLSKIYFPRLVIPLSKAIVGLVDFGVSMFLVALIMLFYRIPITPALFFLPLFIVLALLISLAAGIWLGALSVRYRDIQAVLPILVQFWFFATPVAYSAHSVPANYQFIYNLNPMVGVIQGFRWSLLGGTAPQASILCATGLTLVLLIASLYYFRQVERTLADLI